MTKKIMAFLLTIIMVLSTFSFPVIANDTTKKEANINTPDDVTIVSEDISKRNEFEKHFLLSDDTYIAVSYSEAVHIKDDDGIWQEIDNTLVYDNESKSYKTNGKGFTAEFQIQNSKAKLKNKDGNELAWHYELIGTTSKKSIMKLQKQNAKIALNQKKSAIGAKVSDTSVFEIPKTKGNITFNSAFSSFDADIRYTVSSQKIKEDVILNKQGTVHALVMVVENCNYQASLDENNRVFFTDKLGTEYFYIDSPYMYDSVGAGSTDIDISLNQTGKTVKITYTPSKSWLSDDSRVYPVTFDPEVATNEYTSNIEDSYLTYNSSQANSTSEVLQCSNTSTSYFRVTNIPYTGNLPVINASLTLTAINSIPYNKCLQLQEIEDPSVFDSLSNSINITGTKLSTVTIQDETLVFDVTSIALLAACDRTNTNSLCYKLLLDDTSAIGTVYIASTENLEVSKRPVFTLRYGYKNPDAWVDNTHEDYVDRCWITDSNSIGLREMLWTSGTYCTAFSNTEPRGQFSFEQGTDGLYIYGCYDMCYLSIVGQNNQDLDETRINWRPVKQEANEWIAVRLSTGTYAILHKDYPSMALTRSTSGGIKIELVSSSLANSQKWVVSDCSKPNIGSITDTDDCPVIPGTYYVNSLNTRTFFVNENGLKLKAGTEAELGNKMAWNFQFMNNGQYMIQSIYNPEKYLSVSNSTVSLKSITEGNITDDMLFTLSLQDETYTIKSASNYYLTGSANGIGASSSVDYSAKWRLCPKDWYNELYSWTAFDFQILMGETKNVVSMEFTPFFVDSDDFSTEVSGSTNSCSIIGTTVHSNGASAGAVEITFTHIPTGDSRSCIGFIGDGIFRASNASLALNASSNSNITAKAKIMSDEYQDNDTFGEQLWYTEYVGMIGSKHYYRIHSLGVRDANGTDNNVLTSNSEGTLSLSLGSSNNNYQLWRFEKQSNEAYKIVNKQTNNALYISGSSIVTNSEGSLWTIEDWYELNIMNNGSSGSFYSSVVGNKMGELPIYVQISVDNSVYIDNITQSMFNANSQLYSAWNNISSNVIILKPGETAPANANIYTITYKTISNVAGYEAIVVPCWSGNPSGTYEGHSLNAFNFPAEWNAANIYICTMVLPDKDPQHILGTLIHELGHALLLRHPYESDNIMDDNNENDNTDDYSTKLFILSNMTSEANSDLRSLQPTFYDKINFILEWGV